MNHLVLCVLAIALASTVQFTQGGWQNQQQPAMAKQYACPMDCENGKVYDQPGRCPVCKMKLKEKVGGYTAEVTPSRIQPGAKTPLVFRIKDPAGQPVKSLQSVHEHPAHLLLFSEDLSWFGHEHPRVEKDGTVTVDPRLPGPGEYALLLEFEPTGAKPQAVRLALSAEGPARKIEPLTVDDGQPKTVDGLTARLSHEPLKAGLASEIRLSFSRDGKPVTDLSPYLGSAGHLVIASKDLKTITHVHAEDVAAHEKGHPPAKTGGTRTIGPDISFKTTLPSPGLYKLWGQVQQGDRVVTIPFTVEVK